MKKTIKRSPLQQSLLIAGILLIGLNLRPALAGVGPLIGAIRDSTGLSNTLLGLLTTLPLLAFATLSTLTPLFTKRFGIEETLAGAMVLLTGGILLRVIPTDLTLFGGTLLLGTAIAFGNVLLPSLVKRDFPHKTGLMTSFYSSAMGLGAAIAAGISVPLAVEAGFGWRWSLGAWAAFSTLALLLWLPQTRNTTLPRHNRSFLKAMQDLGGSKLAWQVALFMGLQSFSFYVILAWLPEILVDRGLDPSYAGWMLSLSQGMGLVGSLTLPTWAEKMPDQRLAVWIVVILELISLIGLLLPTTFWVPLWVSLIGIALGGSFGLALLFIVLRTSDTETATELSGMSQSIGYSLAAIGPTLFGALHDLTGAWLLPLGLLFLILATKLFVGLGAAKPKKC
ncbi:MFS transporter [Aliifodinibius sp. S!AR15-10]|uniref:CynX/NimT family MFS transporter n=1 Tax=Aliifodinibius sp. S!AR15-10 TaxID=2950437 RepID=UPI00285D8237|nr:MFS transporter [Aliifodinibius sp. S!AR15-10]MDR8392668.1 MFS transporter [Aliifodinibius sp. S!AR15-10]